MRVVVVIGGASGIGLATAQKFNKAGAAVVVADLDQPRATQVAAELSGDSWAQAVQVGDESTVVALFDAVVERHGRIDAVVNCAGTSSIATITDLAGEEWQRVIDVCLTGAFFVIKHAAGRMNPRGSIVTIASLNSTQPAAGMAAYCAAKAGVVMLTQVAALELGHTGIRVNAISPGLIETPLVAPLLQIPGVGDEFADNTPLGRPGVPADVADAAFFLSEPDSWITGENLTVDGGAHTRRYPDILGRVAALTDQ